MKKSGRSSSALNIMAIVLHYSVSLSNLVSSLAPLSVTTSLSLSGSLGHSVSLSQSVSPSQYKHAQSVLREFEHAYGSCQFERTRPSLRS